MRHVVGEHDDAARAHFQRHARVLAWPGRIVEGAQRPRIAVAPDFEDLAQGRGVPAWLHPQTAVAAVRVLECDPEAHDAGTVCDQIAAILMPAYFATDLGLLEDVHGLHERRRGVVDGGERISEEGRAAESAEVRLEVVERMADLVDRAGLVAIQRATRVESVLLQETVHALARFDEVSIPVTILMLRAEHAAIRLGVEVADDALRRRAERREDFRREHVLEHDVAVPCVFLGDTASVHQ